MEKRKELEERMEREGCWIPWRSSTVKEDKALLLLGYTAMSRGPLSYSSLARAQIHTGGRGDASVGTKVFPLGKLKPLITNWEKREKVGRRGEMDRGQKEGFGNGDCKRKVGGRVMGKRKKVWERGTGEHDVDPINHSDWMLYEGRLVWHALPYGSVQWLWVKTDVRQVSLCCVLQVSGTARCVQWDNKMMAKALFLETTWTLIS